MFSFLPSLKAQNEFQNGTADGFSDLFNEKGGMELFNDFPRTFKNVSLPKAIALNEQRLQIAEKTGNQKSIAALSNNLGMFWLKRGHHDKSLDYLIKSLNARKAINDKKGLALTAGAIGFVYQLTKEYDKALQYYYNTYELSKEQNLQRITLNVSALMGIVYMQKPDTAFAGKYFNEAINGFAALNDKKSQANLYNKIGELYLQRNEYSKSLEYFNLSLKLKEELKDFSGKAIALRNMGIVFFKKGDYEKALEYFNKSLGFSKRLIVKKLIKDSYLKLATVYSFRKEFDKADTYHSLYRELKDSLLRHENSKQISSDGMQQELSEKEKVIELLNKENEEQIKIMNQQGLELSQQLTATEIERQSKEKALEELSLTMIEKKEKEKQLLLLSKQRAEQELELSKKELELSKKTTLMNALVGGSLVILLISFFIYNRYRYKKKSHEVLDKANVELTQTLEKLKSTQTQLMHSQKMASLGELTAGIAHEIQNPLNFVNNFSDLSMDLLDDFLMPASDEKKKELVDNIKENLNKISHHGKRADNIVKNMLQHSRTGTQEKQVTDIHKLAEEFINLAYHSMKTKQADFTCHIEKHFDLNIPFINIVQQDISRVLLNIFNNAFYAVSEKSKFVKDYSPAVTISTNKHSSFINISIKDNGSGIPKEIQDKTFQPFFTTKPPGEGTGLGLSLSYDIITKGHDGAINVESEEGKGTTFIITLPTGI